MYRRVNATRMAFSMRFSSSPVRQSDQGTSENRTTPPTLTGRHVSLEPLAPAHAGGLAEAVEDGRLYDLWYTNVPEANRWLSRAYRQGWQPWSASETVPVVGG